MTHRVVIQPVGQPSYVVTSREVVSSDTIPAGDWLGIRIDRGVLIVVRCHPYGEVPIKTCAPGHWSQAWLE